MFKPTVTISIQQSKNQNACISAHHLLTIQDKVLGDINVSIYSLRLPLPYLTCNEFL